METLNHNNIKRHFNFNKLSNSNLIEDNCPYTNEYKDWDDVLKYGYSAIQKIDDPNGKPEINEEEIITNDEEEDIITNDEENLNRDILNAVDNNEYDENALQDEEDYTDDNPAEDDINNPDEIDENDPLINLKKL